MPFVYFTPRSLTNKSVRAYAPPMSGVYGISNAREWIYIGETDNIQDSLLIHLQELDTPLMRRQPTGFVFEVCGPALRFVRQGRLVLEYKPYCNQRSSGRR
ncbi:MAG: hypothetical protein KIT09_31020 [Bryobacteraceae bacterium]|nr:hypothetical protein [Bryobacteraceae bacterium]